MVIPALHPGQIRPAIPVAPDPRVSQCYAEILLELFRSSARGSGIEFGLNLTPMQNVVSGLFYEWGKVKFDCICSECYSVFPYTSTAALCEECRARII